MFHPPDWIPFDKTCRATEKGGQKIMRLEDRIRSRGPYDSESFRKVPVDSPAKMSAYASQTNSR